MQSRMVAQNIRQEESVIINVIHNANAIVVDLPWHTQGSSLILAGGKLELHARSTVHHDDDKMCCEYVAIVSSDLLIDHLPSLVL